MMKRGARRNDTSLLVADIGGTQARFGLWHQRTLCAPQTLPCSDFVDPAAAALQYLDQLHADLPKPRTGAFAVAAAPLADRIVFTNGGWEFSAAATRRALGLERLTILNDFTALALSVPRLTAAERFQVGGGAPRADAPVAVIGPGTGLGVSGLMRAGAKWLAVQGEGGHATLAAENPRELAVLAAIRRQHAHVSAERVLSGSGLELLYRTLAGLDGVSPEDLAAPEITRRALEGDEPRCREVVTLFCGWLGSVAGNLALTLGAHGGVYIGGGIVPQLGAHFAASPFRERFEAKGRYAPYLAPIPAYVITARYAALVGCAQAMSHYSPRLEAL